MGNLYVLDEPIAGMPPNLGDPAVPHVVTFQGLMGSAARTYRASDEALKESEENARFMRNDASIMECIEQRQRSTALLDWHLEVDDEDDPEQAAVRDELTKILQRIPRFTQYRENLLHALWFGKYAVESRYQWRRLEGEMRVCVTRWKPVHGDKLVFRYEDDTGEYDPDGVGIRIGATFGTKAAQRWQYGREDQIETTDRGRAYFLTPRERALLAIHKHMIEDGEYEEPLNAGRIHGVGIRSRIYWTWYQKQEALAWLMEFLERSAFGFEIWYYPMGNDQARQDTQKAAEERIGLGRNIVLVPRPSGDDAMMYGTERIEPSMSGAEALRTILTEYFGHQIKRYILGQTLTTEADATGLGSNLASIHLDTYLQIIRYDATNLEETITTDLVDPLKAFNFPQHRELPVRFKIETEIADVEAKLNAWRQAYDMGAELKASQVMDLVGAAVPSDEDEVLRQQAPVSPPSPKSFDQPFDNGNAQR